MGRAKKKGASTTGEFSLFDESDSADADSEEDLPRDEAGRAKIKHQYVDLLGIRVQKLAGRILNRERINKTLEGIYFVCLRCKKVCHNLDEGLVEDPENKANTCTPCAKQSTDSSKSVTKKAAAHKSEAPKPEAPQSDDTDDLLAPAAKKAPAKPKASAEAKAPAKPKTPAKPAAPKKK